MPPPIARTYSSHDKATAAAEELKNRGYGNDGVHIVDPSQGTDPMSAVLQAGIPRHAAPVYADALRRGESLVVIHPFFGKSLGATSILHGFEPTTTHVGVPDADPVAEAARADVRITDAAPFSKLFGWRVLSSDPTPLSTKLKWPTLRKEPVSSRTLDKIRRQSDDPAPLSKKIGMQVLSPDPAPLSSLLRLKPVCNDCPAPLSSRFKWQVLINDPAPLSRLLNLKVLWRQKRRPVRYVRYL